MSAVLAQPVVATHATAPPSYLPPPYEDAPPVLQVEPAPAAASIREARPIACRFGGDCGMMFTGLESTATIRQHLQTAHGVEVHSEASSQPVRCPWAAEDGAGCSATIRTSGLAKHLRDVHLHVGAMRCERCGRRLSREDAFRRHLLRCNGPSDELMIADGN